MRCPSATIGTVVSQFPVLSRRQKVSLMQIEPATIASERRRTDLLGPSQQLLLLLLLLLRMNVIATL